MTCFVIDLLSSLLIQLQHEKWNEKRCEIFEEREVTRPNPTF